MRAAKRPFRTAALCALPVLVTLAPNPARADFFDGARKTFQTDIPNFFTRDVPHFFQDDVPCAFGGEPTSGVKKSCASPGPSTDEATPPKEAPPKNGAGNGSSPPVPQ